MAFPSQTIIFGGREGLREPGTVEIPEAGFVRCCGESRSPLAI